MTRLNQRRGWNGQKPSVAAAIQQCQYGYPPLEGHYRAPPVPDLQQLQLEMMVRRLPPTLIVISDLSSVSFEMASFPSFDGIRKS